MGITYWAAIAVHAAAGVLALLTGAVLAAFPRFARRRWTIRSWFVLLSIVVAGLCVAVIAGWGLMDIVRRLVDVGLIMLAFYTLYRGARAVGEADRETEGWRPRFIDHIGFSVISLFDGFVIIAAIRADFPGWVVAAIAVGGVAAGIVGIHALKSRAEHSGRPEHSGRSEHPRRAERPPRSSARPRFAHVSQPRVSAQQDLPS